MGKKMEIQKEVWEAFAAVYLRPCCPEMTACYERLRYMAHHKGWTIPSLSTLRRRMAEIPEHIRRHLRNERPLTRIRRIRIDNLEAHGVPALSIQIAKEHAKARKRFVQTAREAHRAASTPVCIPTGTMGTVRL